MMLTVARALPLCLFIALAVAGALHVPVAWLGTEFAQRVLVGLVLLGAPGVVYHFFAAMHMQKKLRSMAAVQYHNRGKLKNGLAQQAHHNKQTIAAFQAELDELKQTVNSVSETAGAAVMTEMKVLQSQINALQQLPHDRVLPPDANKAVEMSPASTPPSDQQITASLRSLRQALIDDRVALYLQPIVALSDNRHRYFEAYSRIHMADGQVLLPEAFVQQAADSGLLPIIDNLLLFRCVQRLRQFHRQDPDVGFFVNISSASIADGEFFPQFVEMMENNPSLSQHLVFEFPQADVVQNWHAMQAEAAKLAEIGCRLSIDKVTHLDMDFADLARKRVRFIKVPLTVLDQSKATQPARYDSRDLKDVLGRLDIDLIVTDIETERDQKELSFYQVDFAQGYLFGTPERSHQAA